MDSDTEIFVPQFVRFAGAAVVELPVYPHDVFLRQLNSWNSTAFISLTNATNAQILAIGGLNPNVLAAAFVQSPALGLKVRIRAGSQTFATTDIAGSLYYVLSWDGALTGDS